MATDILTPAQYRELTSAPTRARNKYGVRIDNEGKAQRTYKGQVYASLAEARQAALLDLRKKAGEIAAWDRQPRYRLIVNGALICTYVSDFRVRYADGWEEVIDVKGHITPVAKIKMALYEALAEQNGWPVLMRVQT